MAAPSQVPARAGRPHSNRLRDNKFQPRRYRFSEGGEGGVRAGNGQRAPADSDRLPGVGASGKGSLWFRTLWSRAAAALPAEMPTGLPLTTKWDTGSEGTQTLPANHTYRLNEASPIKGPGEAPQARENGRGAPWYLPSISGHAHKQVLWPWAGRPCHRRTSRALRVYFAQSSGHERVKVLPVAFEAP